LGVGVGAAEWVSLSYVLVLVAILTPVGRWADSVGRKSLYVGGFAAFTVASAGCAFAPDLPVLLGCRAAQAIGAALLQANSVALIAAAVPARRLGRSVGVQAASQAIGLAAGPAIGGALLAVGSWRLLFLVNVPTGVVGVLTGALLLPRSRDLAPPRRLDPRGLAGFVVAIAVGLLALSLLSGSGRTRLVAVPVAAVAVALGALVTRHERHAAEPLVDRALRRADGVPKGLVATFLAYAALFGSLVAVPLFLTGVGAGGSARIGLELAALPLGIGVTAPLAGGIADRAPRRVARVGLGIATVALAALAMIRPTGLGLTLLLAVLGVGLGAFTPANNRAVMLSAPAGTSGAAAGLLNMMRGLGTAAGTAVAVVGFTAAGFATVATMLACCCLVAIATLTRP
jgi:MFS family permease